MRVKQHAVKHFKSAAACSLRESSFRITAEGSSRTVADFAGDPAHTRRRTVDLQASGEQDVPVITAKVVHRDAEKASMEARMLGGVYDEAQHVWVFRATSTFELRGGVMRLRSAGLLPLEMRYGDQLEAIWIEFDFGRRVMQWRPVGDRTRLTLRKGSWQGPP